MISVLIVDDQPLQRAGFRLILESQPDIEVVGEAALALEALGIEPFQWQRWTAWWQAARNYAFYLCCILTWKLVLTQRTPRQDFLPAAYVNIISTESN